MYGCVVNHSTELVVDMPTEAEVPAFPDLGDKASDAALEQYKARLAVWVAAQNQDAVLTPAMASLIGGFAQIGLRSLFLANGGGLVAILALLGNTWGKPGAIDLASRLEPTAKEFGSGLTCAFLATGTAYLSQLLFIDFRHTTWGYRSGRWTQAACFGLCAITLCLFVGGAWSGISAIGKRSVIHTTSQSVVWSTIQRGDT